MIFKMLKTKYKDDRTILLHFWAGILFIPFVLLLVVGGIVWFATTSAIRDTCELTCEPYVVEMCDMDLAACRTPEGIEVRKKRSKF